MGCEREEAAIEDQREVAPIGLVGVLGMRGVSVGVIGLREGETVGVRVVLNVVLVDVGPNRNDTYGEG